MPSSAPPYSATYSLDSWLQAPVTSSRHRGRTGPPRPGPLRFAFYGRFSTVGYQDPATSRAWQLESAGRLIAGRGRVVAEFFDEGWSRSLPWTRRPQAAALLAAAANPACEFDAVVVAEFERAFTAGQAQSVIAQLNAYGVQLWLPELEGPVDLAEPEHRAMLKMLGHQSQREVLRNRFRTSAAMAAQVREQGRNLGGRPPYGYLLVDAGPHPNKVHAKWGRRLHRLDIDPVAAPHVRWIFACRLQGCSVSSIARALNERGVPSPSAHDPERNPHRRRTVWTLRTVAAILANPRYTGQQVWNRQFTDHREAVPGDKRSSMGPVRVWNPRSDWVVSAEQTHPELVSAADYLAAQGITAVAEPDSGQVRRYALTGLLICAVCGRRMSAHWLNRKPGYRCRHGHTSAQLAAEGMPPWVYWPQERLFSTLQALDAELADLGDAEDLGAYLRANDLVVVCGSGTLEIEDAIVESADEFDPVTPADPGADGYTATVADQSPVPAQRGPAQLALPFTVGGRRRGRGPVVPDAVAIRKAWTAENPGRNRVKRE
ncbi:recombinase family protein [Actinoplanes awajinensis]|uniref:recombinase family protein n=1 Tax=Actinoplanes awajinensis TaxID=135946 RepID=UPI0012FC723B|nr:recombinase family protein [Actinoplanes awajinensis]